MNSIIRTAKELLHRIWYSHLDPQERARALKSRFHYMGNNVSLFTNHIGTEPYLISIYDNVTVAADVRFITHDVSVFNLSRYMGLPAGEHLDKVGPITLNENCMIGAYSILMPGCSVGKNSVVAAGSVVTKCVPDNEVWGGVPAKYIMTIDEYAHKLLERNMEYPWIKDGKFVVSQGSDELIRMRQEYFFGMHSYDEKGK